MKRINPLILFEKYIEEGRLDQKIYQQSMKRIKIVDDAIKRVEKNTTLDYPDYFIEPSLFLSSSDLEYGQYTVMYARTIPICTRQNQIKIMVQLSLPLVLYGLRGTIHAVMAHEFLHYLDLVKKFITLDISSDIIPQTVFEAGFLDTEKTVDYRLVFKKDRSLRRMLDLKFDRGLVDPKLDKKTKTSWIDRKLPTKQIVIESNYTNLPFHAIANTPIENHLRTKLMEWA
ncbi:MAG TPA: hypothetical protein VJR94_11555 [Candidatus Nitrosocosmicus sp.]|nr:hypothetical protein [Candidatus Nitrosocosmicus sp.]